MTEATKDIQVRSWLAGLATCPFEYVTRERLEKVGLRKEEVGHYMRLARQEIIAKP